MAFEQEVAEIINERSRPVQQPGRRGFQTWEQLEESERIGDERIFEIASLILAPELLVAVLAVRAPRYVRERLADDAAGIDVYPQPKWSAVSARDIFLRKILADLSEGAVSVAAEEFDPSALSTAAIANEFRGGFRFYVFQKGDEDKCATALNALALSEDTFTNVFMDMESGLFDRLEHFLFNIRARYNCIGFFPCLRELYDRSSKWDTDGYEEPLVWNAQFSQIEAWMKYRSAVRQYFAINGSLFELNPWLWEQVPYNEEVSFKTIRLRPKVSVAGKDEKTGTVTLAIQPLPGLVFPPVVVDGGDPEEVAQAKREELGAGNPAARMVYSAKPRGGSHPPFGDSAEAPATGWQILGQERKVVLIPRHFLCTGDEMSIELLADLSEQPPRRVRGVVISGEGVDSKLMVGNATSILGSIDEAFRSNRYGGVHREIGFHQTQLATVQGILKEKVDQSRLESIHIFETSSGPYYHFTAADLTALELVPGSDLHTRLVHRGDVLTLKKIEGEPASENIWAPDTPLAYNAFRTFLALLADFDADFLLSQILESGRVRLERDADAWREATSAFIFSQYIPANSSKLDVKSIRSLAPSWTKKPDDAFSYTFISTSKVLRKPQAWIYSRCD